EFAEAEALLTSLLDENANDGRALRNLLELYLRANRREEALALLERRVAENIDDEPLLLMVVRFYKDLGEYGRMLDGAERILLNEPEGPERNTGLASLALDRKQYEKAAQFAEAALAANPADPARALHVLAQALSELGRTAEAERRYEQAVAKHPDQAADL